MPDRHLEDSDALAFPEEEEQRPSVEIGPDLEDEGAEDHEPISRPRRRLFGRRRQAEMEPEALPDEEDDHRPGPDWNAVVGDQRPGAQWVDWSAPDPPAETVLPEEPEAAPAGSQPDYDAVAVWETDGALTPPGEAGSAAGVTQADSEPPADVADTASIASPAAEVSPPSPNSDPGGPEVATDEAASTDGDDEPPPVRYRSTPSWPPPRRPRFAVGLLCSVIMIVLVVLLVTNGQIGQSERMAGSEAAEERPALRTDPESVPRDWIVYRHTDIEFGLSYPPGWTVREEGSVVRLTDPTTGAELRIAHRKPPGNADPEQTWLSEEPNVTNRYPDYRRLQLSRASYLGHKAALWEYTFSEGNRLRHVADLGFVTKRDRFGLYFVADATDWERMLPVFQGFLSSFKTPS